MNKLPKNFKLDELYLDLTSDWGFKYILGSSENKEFTISFINSVLPQKDHVTDVQFLPTEHIGADIDSRVAVFDIICTTNDQRKILIEMQKLPQTYFSDRTLFYSTWPIQSQAIKGNWDYRLNKVYVISVITFKLNSSTDHFENHHKILNTETYREYTQALEFITLELPSFRLQLEESKTPLEKWIWAFLNLNKVKYHPPEFVDSTLKRLIERAELHKFSKKNLNEYKMSLYNERNLKPFTDYARDKGFEEGEIKGRQEGREEGRVEGRAEGELKAKQELAKKLLDKGMSVEEVATLTGLDLEK